jgi:uroporphyrinogen III methyltransferase/synthase
MPETPGIVYLVGAGPGDPGLLTRRGYEVLRCADVVVYDQLANDRLLDLAPASAERIFAGKIQGKLTITQGDMNRLLAERAGRGLKVVRLKGGDPYVFGRGAEVAVLLHLAGIPFLVIPGVTAGVGVTAYAGIPVTHRDIASAVAFVTGHDDPEATTSDRARLNWSALAAFPGTLVIYMGVTRLASICRTLVREGKPETTPAAMVQSGTLARQRTVTGTLATLADRVTTAGLGPPALLVVGEVIDRRPGLNWFEERPLFGRRIVVTRPEDDSDRSASILEDLGAEVLTAPTVAIRPVVDTSELDAAIARLDEFDWLVFTSSNGVKHLLDRIDALGLDQARRDWPGDRRNARHLSTSGRSCPPLVSVGGSRRRAD